MVSANPTDAAEGYCGACHDWTGDTRERCRPVLDDDGALIATYHGGPMDERGQAAMRALVAAVQQCEAANPDPDRGERQAAAIARIRERAARLRDGRIPG
jgi:hypothetical protein